VKEAFANWLHGMRGVLSGGSMPRETFEVLGIILSWLGIAWFVYISSTDPRSAARRVAQSYTQGIDTRFRSMFLPQRGVYMAWLQRWAPWRCS